MVFRPHDAEEVTQEVLVKVITKLSTFKGKSTFRTWLYRIAANHVLNMKRRWAETRTTTFAVALLFILAPMGNKHTLTLWKTLPRIRFAIDPADFR
jgi:DNA-directed RNA polymerase specialized sigma24 family protein